MTNKQAICRSGIWRFPVITWGLSIVVVLLVCTATVRADLTSEEVAVIANSEVPESMDLARYYITARQIPEKNLCPVSFTGANQLSRTKWEQTVRPQIRQWLETNDPERRIRCLVTVWGVPLVIGPDERPLEQDPYRQFLEQEREFRRQSLLAVFQQITELGIDPDSIPSTEPDPGRDVLELDARFQQIVQAAQARLNEKNNDPSLARGFEQALMLVGGNALIYNSLERAVQNAGATASETQQRQLYQFRGRLEMARDAIAILDLLPPSVERDTAILATLERAEGAMGTLNWIDRELAMTATNETSAALDSELALIFRDNGYRLHRWAPNYLRSGMEHLQISRKFPTMMVARLDGPSAEAARKLVDAALQVEQNGGLTGTFYVDARGLDPDNTQQPPAFLQMEQSLLMAGGMVQQSGVAVIADKKPMLFQPTDNCISAAIYCGWYSLGKYVDAFEFVPGAVGYHLSTIEAAGLRGVNLEVDSSTSGWCYGLLNDGCAVTIGAVGESGLAALPMPHEFFGQLVAGHSTVGESYWRSVPHTSWQVILVGDPLYRPFPAR